MVSLTAWEPAVGRCRHRGYRDGGGACRLRLFSLSLAVALGLAGCGDDSAEEGLEDSAAAAQAEAQAAVSPTGCPGVSIPDELAQVTEFAPGSRQTPDDIMWRASIGDYTGGCEYDDNSVTVDLDTLFVVELGTAAPSNEITFDYFVAVLRPDGSRMAKQVFSLTVEVDEETGQRVAVDETQHVFPLRIPAEGPGFELWLGFQPTASQLEYNRR